MEIGTLATALVAGATARVQLAVAAKLMRMNIDAERSVVDLMQAATQNASRMADAVATGIGGNLDLTV